MRRLRKPSRRACDVYAARCSRHWWLSAECSVTGHWRQVSTCRRCTSAPARSTSCGPTGTACSRSSCRSIASAIPGVPVIRGRGVVIITSQWRRWQLAGSIFVATRQSCVGGMRRLGSVATVSNASLLTEPTSCDLSPASHGDLQKQILRDMFPLQWLPSLIYGWFKGRWPRSLSCCY